MLSKNTDYRLSHERRSQNHLRQEINVHTWKDFPWELNHLRTIAS